MRIRLFAVLAVLALAAPAAARNTDCRAACERRYQACMWGCRDICDTPAGPRWCLDPQCATWCSNEWWACIDQCDQDCPWWCGGFCCRLTEEECELEPQPVACSMDQQEESCAVCTEP